MRSILCIASIFLYSSVAGADTRLLRYPDLHGNQVVFTHAGDLWLANDNGSNVRRLTSHPGQELFAKFSPDGREIAFTGQYGGDEQVYVMSVDGGEPTQLTWYPSEGPLPARWGFDHQVYGWTPDGSAVLFRSVRQGYSLTDSRLYAVKVSGGLPEALPMKISGAGTLSPDGSQVLFSPLFRDFRTWKRYEGGWAQDLFIFDMDGTDSRNITNHVRTDRDPMWTTEGIFFVSDRDDYLNIYVYDETSGQAQQLTRHQGSDVRWASDDGAGRIVYELNGALRIIDVTDNSDRQLSITVPADTGVELGELVKVADHLQNFDVSPNGARILVAARGEVFSAAVEHGITRNLTNSPGAHDREASWSPQGDRVAWISDASGEEEIYVGDPLGQADAESVTPDMSTRIYSPSWSPDGELIAYSDSEAKIYVVDIDNKRSQQIADDGGFVQHDIAWSPDSQWLAYSLEDANGFRSLHIWSRSSAESRRITGDMFSEYDPAFSANGQQLFYLSDRMFAPQLGNIEWNYVNNRNTGVFVMMLRQDSANPFAPRNLEGLPAEKPKDDSAEESEDIDVRIDFDGLAGRVARAPVEFDNYNGLTATTKQILFSRSGPAYYGRDSHLQPELVSYSLEDRDTRVIAADISGYSLARQGNQVIVRQDGALKRYELDKQKTDVIDVDISGLTSVRVRSAEFEQIFDEVWRRFRDHFYVRNMHGYDWEALRDRYRELLSSVGHRSELNYLLGEMVAELNVGHAYIAGGELGAPERPSDALLGATFELDAAAGRYRIAEIYAGQNEEDRYRSPLTEAGVQASAGDYVLAINGRELTTDVNPYALLKGAGNGLIELQLSADARGRNSQTALVRPVASENSLLYLRWVAHNREYVSDKTDGKVGYLHVPDMGASGIYEFIKWYYGQIRKQGLIVDVRGNGGGNVSQMLINRLDREHVFMDYDRGVDNVSTYPNAVFTGPMVGLLNADSASDGDIFPAAFQHLGLGPLIGKRSWGGVIGITNLGDLMDGGNVFVPQFGTAAAAGEWTVEGTGVSPDIEVDNPPHSVLDGEDRQLDRAIQEVVQMLQDNPGTLPPRPADPVKTPGR